MDRFRVQSLCKLLKIHSMEVDQIKAVKTTLNKKLRILRLGALKRENTELLAWLDTMQSDL